MSADHVRPWTSSSPAWKHTSGGTTRRGSKSPLVLAALSGIAKAWESPFNQPKFSAAPPKSSRRYFDRRTRLSGVPFGAQALLDWALYQKMEGQRGNDGYYDDHDE